VSRACKLTGFPRSQFYYSSKRDDKELIDALQGLAFKHPSYAASGSFLLISEDPASLGTTRKYTECTSF
jgi:putative transposase